MNIWILSTVLSLLSIWPPFLAEAAKSTKTESTKSWDYSDSLGPEKWASLSPQFSTCKTGKEQSPIDIVQPQEQKLSYIRPFYRGTRLHILNTGNTIRVRYEPGSYARIDGKRYDLTHLDFHSPSEHLIGGKAAEMEIQLVHQAADKRLAIISILIEKGDRHDFFLPIWEHLPKDPDSRLFIHSKEMWNALHFFPREPSFFRYPGSLTTPPCTENVLWTVMTEPIQLSIEQIDRFRTFYKSNARPVQSLGTRTVASFR